MKQEIHKGQTGSIPQLRAPTIMAWALNYRTLEKFLFDCTFSVLPLNCASTALEKQFGYNKIAFS